MKAALDGVRVIDLTRVLAGPFCTMLMGDMGAEILKIEEPRHGDDTRAWAPFVDGWSTFFLGMNRSKKSVALDLRNAGDAEALRRLVKTADVLIENFRPGSLARLSFGYEDVQKINPSLVYCSISGYGQTGPKHPLPGYDTVIQGEAGLMDITGFPDGPPTRVGVAITDYLAGLFAFNGILLALRERDKSGLGQHVDVGLLDALTSALALPAQTYFGTGNAPGRVGNEHHTLVPYETLPVRDGLVIVAVGNARLWGKFCVAIDAACLEHDPRFETNTDRMQHRADLDRELEGRLGRFTREELIDRLRAHTVPCGEVKTRWLSISRSEILERFERWEIQSSCRAPLLR